jgi:hypothetical protein
MHRADARCPSTPRPQFFFRVQPFGDLFLSMTVPEPRLPAELVFNSASLIAAALMTVRSGAQYPEHGSGLFQQLFLRTSLVAAFHVVTFTRIRRRKRASAPSAAPAHAPDTDSAPADQLAGSASDLAHGQPGKDLSAESSAPRAALPCTPAPDAAKAVHAAAGRSLAPAMFTLADGTPAAQHEAAQLTAEAVQRLLALARAPSTYRSAVRRRTTSVKIPYAEVREAAGKLREAGVAAGQQLGKAWVPAGTSCALIAEHAAVNCGTVRASVTWPSPLPPPAQGSAIPLTHTAAHELNCIALY